MKGLGGPSTALRNLISLVSLVLEMSGLVVPLIDLIRDGVEGHDPLYEGCRDPGRKEADEHIVVCDAGTDNVILEDQDVTVMIYPILFFSQTYHFFSCNYSSSLCH